MHRTIERAGKSLGDALAVVVVAFVSAVPCWAITLSQIDDFNDGTTQHWGVTHGFTPVSVVPDGGATGAVGDHALLMNSGQYGGGRLLVVNEWQWLGDWTAAKIEKISMDVRNPNDFELVMHVGIGGPGGVGGGGSGDTHVTPGITVPPDGMWHHVLFDVLADDFTSLNGFSTAAALANVTHARILHNRSDTDFLGEIILGQFLLDNITAVGPQGVVLGDYNGNGVVDAADYVVWRSNPASLMNEGASLGVVDPADYDYWWSRFGATSGAGVGAGSVMGAAAVPEPASWMFMTGLFIFAWVLVRSRV